MSFDYEPDGPLMSRLPQNGGRRTRSAKPNSRDTFLSTKKYPADPNQERLLTHSWYRTRALLTIASTYKMLEMSYLLLLILKQVEQVMVFKITLSGA